MEQWQLHANLWSDFPDEVIYEFLSTRPCRDEKGRPERNGKLLKFALILHSIFPQKLLISTAGCWLHPLISAQPQLCVTVSVGLALKQCFSHPAIQRLVSSHGTERKRFVGTDCHFTEHLPAAMVQDVFWHGEWSPMPATYLLLGGAGVRFGLDVHIHSCIVSP